MTEREPTDPKDPDSANPSSTEPGQRPDAQAQPDPAASPPDPRLINALTRRARVAAN